MAELNHAAGTKSAEGRAVPQARGRGRRRVCFDWAGRLEDRTLLSVVPALVSEVSSESSSSTILAVSDRAGAVIEATGTAPLADASSSVAIAGSTTGTTGGLSAAEAAAEVLPPVTDVAAVSGGMTATGGLDTSATAPRSDGSGPAEGEGGAADAGSGVTGDSDAVWQDSAEVIEGLLTGSSAVAAEGDERTGEADADTAITNASVLDASDEVAQRADGVERFASGATIVAAGRPAASVPVIRSAASAARNMTAAALQVIERGKRAASVVELSLSGLTTSGGEAALNVVESAQSLIADGLKVVSAKLLLVGPSPGLDPSHVMDSLDDADAKNEHAAEPGTVTVMRIAEAVAVAAVVYAGREATRRDRRVRRTVGRWFSLAWGAVARGRSVGRG